MRGLIVVSVLAGCSAQSSLGYVTPPASTSQHVALGALHDQLAVALQTAYRAQTDRVPAPVSLVPTDGSELALKQLSAQVAIDGPVAHTELRFAFHNAEERTREGRFAITLPPGAAVTRFAMKVHGEWREARVVARERGREVFETLLKRRIDPALLEQDAGNQFSARVFPIFAREDKEIIVAYDHEVASTYTLALHGLPRVERLAIAIEHDGATRSIERAHAVPEDVVLDVAPGTAAVAAGEAFVARVEGAVAGAGDAPLDRVLYLVDTSASRAPVMGKQVAVLRALLRAQQPDSTVAIAVFDQTVVEMYRGPAGGADHALATIFDHGALGASNLGAALERAATAGLARVVIIGDGVATAGEHDAAKLAAIVSDSPIERVDVVQVGHSIDRAALQRLVRAARTPGAIVDGGAPAIAARQLATAVAPPLAIRVDGATQTWPATTRDVAPGEPVFVYGLFAGAGPLVVHVGDRAVTVTPRKGHARLRRTVARAELADLVARAPAEPQLGEQIEKLALAHDLVSPRTSLLVLESDADEQRFLDGPTAPAAPVAPTAQTATTISQDYTRNIPVPRRTFESALGAAAGAQTDVYGVALVGTTSLENTYYVDGIGIADGEYCLIIPAEPPSHMCGATRPRVRADVMSPLALEVAAEAIRYNAFAFDTRSVRASEYTPPKPTYARPYHGTLHDVMSAIAKRDARALDRATAWHVNAPGDVAAILALGEALEASGAGKLAARAYGSLADLYPNRAELLRAAGERLDRVADRVPSVRPLAIDFYRRALRERPDHASTYRLLAYALLRWYRADEGLAIVLEGAQHTSSLAMKRILAEDASIIAANIVARQPARRYDLPAMPLPIATAPSVRFVLTWETDANDVDLHVRDGRGGHVFAKGDWTLASGGRLLEDASNGYGPEMLAIEGAKAFPYRLAAHYASKGPMGIGLGTVQVIRHDGAGGVVIDDRPFVIQNDNAMVELGAVER